MSVAEVAEWVWLARIRRTQGRKGEVFADILTDFPERFSERRQLWLLREGEVAARPVTLTAHWPHKGGIVLHFSGVDSISAAETLAGLIVVIPREQRAELPADEVHIADLIGCTVIDLRGEERVEVGVIENVDRTAGPVPLLIVRSARGEILVPFAKAFLKSLDLAAHRVEMTLPEGLTELNG